MGHLNNFLIPGVSEIKSKNFKNLLHTNKTEKCYCLFHNIFIYLFNYSS